MLLYLLRHADADTPAPSDDARPLSEKGIDQAKKVARFCEAHDMQLSLILTSPLRRASTSDLLKSIRKDLDRKIRAGASGAQKREKPNKS